MVNAFYLEKTAPPMRLAFADAALATTSASRASVGENTLSCWSESSL
jgi:hypothetical protein